MQFRRLLAAAILLASGAGVCGKRGAPTAQSKRDVQSKESALLEASTKHWWDWAIPGWNVIYGVKKGIHAANTVSSVTSQVEQTLKDLKSGALVTTSTNSALDALLNHKMGPGTINELLNWMYKERFIATDALGGFTLLYVISGFVKIGIQLSEAKSEEKKAQALSLIATNIAKYGEILTSSLTSQTAVLVDVLDKDLENLLVKVDVLWKMFAQCAESPDCKPHNFADERTHELLREGLPKLDRALRGELYATRIEQVSLIRYRLQDILKQNLNWIMIRTEMFKYMHFMRIQQLKAALLLSLISASHEIARLDPNYIPSESRAIPGLLQTSMLPMDGILADLTIALKKQEEYCLALLQQLSSKGFFIRSKSNHDIGFATEHGLQEFWYGSLAVVRSMKKQTPIYPLPVTLYKDDHAFMSIDEHGSLVVQKKVEAQFHEFIDVTNRHDNMLRLLSGKMALYVPAGSPELGANRTKPYRYKLFPAQPIEDFDGSFFIQDEDGGCWGQSGKEKDSCMWSKTSHAWELYLVSKELPADPGHSPFDTKRWDLLWQ